MDRSSLRPFQSSLSHSDKERWVCIYPCYLNSRRTRARGRKIAENKGVDNPKQSEVTFVLSKLGLDYFVETKVHPRELDFTEPSIRWRVRVHLKHDDGSAINDEFPNRLSLLLTLSSAISSIRARRVPVGVPSSAPEQTKKGKKKRK